MSSPPCTPAERYRRGWSRCWGLGSVAGLGLAMLVWSPAVVVLGLALDTACVAAVWALVRACLGTTQPQRRPGPHLVLRSLSGVTTLVAMAAVLTVSAAVALCVLLAAVLLSPGVQDLHRITRPREDDHDLLIDTHTTEPGSRWPADGSLFHA